MKTSSSMLNVSNRQRWTALALIAWGLLVSWQAGAVGTWIPLVSTIGTNGGHMLLLSDATVMVQNGHRAGWFRLTPGSTGGYTNGTWTSLSAMEFERQYYSSDVLPDGRVFVAGGEHPDEPAPGPQYTNAEVYNPWNDTWTTTAYAGGVGFSDSISVVLPNGNVMVAPVYHNNLSNNVTLIYNPTLDSWATNSPVSFHTQSEVSWVKLPDDSILTVDKANTSSERFIPSQNQWIVDTNVPVNLWTNGETGAGLLLPDGRAIYLGALGHTAIYTPSGTTNMGAWVAGPDIPDGMVASDLPAAMMPNGKILCAAGTTSPNGGSPPPIWFYEYDYTMGNTTNAFAPTSSPRNTNVGSAYDPTAVSRACQLSMLDLPDGTVLLSDMSDELGSTGQLYVYQPDTPPLAAGKPIITSVTANQDGSYHLTGNGLNGISQGAAFGDEAQQDSNYPIVRFTDGSGYVYYGRTYNWSSTSVQTGTKIMSTEFRLPTNLPAGISSLAVVANGNASDPVAFAGPVFVDFNYTGPTQDGSYNAPFKTLARGTNAVSNGGIIIIKTAGSSAETMTISKPMTIISVGGAATIGH